MSARKPFAVEPLYKGHAWDIKLGISSGVVVFRDSLISLIEVIFTP